MLYSEPCVKLVGTHINSQLNFNYHVTELCRKAANQVKALGRLSGMLDTESKLMIVNAFILSNFMYCPLICHMCSVQNTICMEKVQKRGLYYVFNTFNDTYVNLLQRASKSTLYLTRLRFLAIENFKIIHNVSAAYMKNLFVKNAITRELRGKDNSCATKM